MYGLAKITAGNKCGNTSFLNNSKFSTERYFFPLCLSSILFFCKRNPVDRYMGELSYPIYIWHALIAALITHYVLPEQNTNIYPLLVIVITILISWLSFEYFIKPLDRYREKRVINR
jgi:peptidoglycan/LPS O-acetylase OafA/YrhL